MKLIRGKEYPALDPGEGVERLGFPGFNTRVVIRARGCVIPRPARSEEMLSGLRG